MNNLCGNHFSVHLMYFVVWVDTPLAGDLPINYKNSQSVIYLNRGDTDQNENKSSDQSCRALDLWQTLTAKKIFYE